MGCKDDILSRKVKVCYHKLCRSSHIHKKALERLQKPTSSDNSKECDTVKPHLSRCDTSALDIQKQCFICGKDAKRGERLIPTATGTGQSSRENVLAAAQERQDNKVHLRMLAHPDLLAFDAKYHRPCYSHYISKRNIAYAQ